MHQEAASPRRPATGVSGEAQLAAAAAVAVPLSTHDVCLRALLFIFDNQEAGCHTCTAMMPLLTDLRRRSAEPGQADRLRASRLLKSTVEDL